MADPARAALLYEAGYIEIVRDGAGRPSELWPIMPWRVQPYRERGQLFYRVAGEGGSDVVLSPRDLLILRGPTPNGITGHPTFQRARQAIGDTLAAERVAAGFFGRGSTFGGLLSHPRVLGEKAAKNLRESIEAMHRGPDKAHRFAILEEGITFTKLGVDPDHAQMIESRKFQLAEVARYYHVPPSKLGQLEDSNHSTRSDRRAEYPDQGRGHPVHPRRREALTTINRSDQDLRYLEYFTCPPLGADFVAVESK